MKTTNRNPAYDIIRIVALLMIVMVHVSAYLVIFFPATDQIEWPVGNFFNGLARAGVPMFILLSGALLLREDKTVDARRFYKKSLLNMALLAAGWMVAYGLFYAVILPLLEGREVQMSNFWLFLLRFQGSEYPHLWYMLMVLGMYLMIPVLRLFVKRENKPYIVGIIIAAVVFQFAGRTADILTLNGVMSVSAFLGKFHMQPATGFIGVLLIGWYLNEYTLGRRARILLYAAGLLSVAVSTLTVYYTIDAIPAVRDFVYSELSLPALIYGTALFVFIQSVRGKGSSGRLTAELADCSFGVYLFHVAVLEIFVRLILPYERFGPGRPLSYILILFGFTLLVSFAVVKVVGRFKGIRRIFYNR